MIGVVLSVVAVANVAQIGSSIDTAAELANKAQEASLLGNTIESKNLLIDAGLSLSKLPEAFRAHLYTQALLSLPSLISIPALPNYLGDFKGFDLLSAANLPPTIPEDTAGKISEKKHTVGGACGKQKEALDFARQRVGQIEAKKEIEFKKVASNLIYSKGSITGQTDKICGNENVQGFYSFDPFGCQDLWFSFSEQERPLCNFDSGEWENGINKGIFGSSCNQTNTTSYHWVSTDAKSGYRVYNSTGIHQLFNTTADKLFQNPVEDSTLDIFIGCDPGPGTTKIEDKFRFLNYTETCG